MVIIKGCEVIMINLEIDVNIPISISTLSNKIKEIAF